MHAGRPQGRERGGPTRIEHECSREIERETPMLVRTVNDRTARRHPNGPLLNADRPVS